MDQKIKERPILFNAEMVRAILAGRKTQTRRAVKGMALEWLEDSKFIPEYVASPDNDMCPNGKIGDQLWVREAFSAMGSNEGHALPIFYRADGEDGNKWTPSIHMPRWASRIQLEITNIRLERINQISEDDAKAEGMRFHHLYNEWGGVEKHPASTNSLPQWRWYESPSKAFQHLWNSIYKNWDTNPWVWVIEFKRIAP